MYLTQDFFRRYTTTELAKELLGTFLEHTTQAGITVGRIVETEAYLYDDPACHASRGKTKRNEVMFKSAGFAYIYFIYGMHYCFNVVSGEEGKGEAVLIRAIEPVEGVDLMQERRGSPSYRNLCNGPARLVKALGIQKEQNGMPLFEGTLRVKGRVSYKELFPVILKDQIVTTTRIGIRQGADLPLRFYLKNNGYVSKLEKRTM